MWLGPGTVLSLFQLQGVMRTQNYTSFDTWLKVMVLACLCMALGFSGLLAW
jgi:hypothetical protein